MHIRRSVRCVVLPVMIWLCVSCSSDRSSAPAAAPAAANESASERQGRLARAAADAVEAGHALARSIKLDNARNSRSDVPTSSDVPSHSQTALRNSVAAMVAKIPIRMSEDGYRDLDWLQMMPKDEIAALDDPKNVVQIRHTGNTRTKQFGSFHIVDSLDEQKVQIAGFVVPLEADDQGNMTELFFVPFYGACIHVPPPPPNQIVYAKLAKGIKPPQIWDPYWLKGVLRTRTVSNKVAGSAYSMDQAILVPWNG
jgi:hypothetical protein